VSVTAWADALDQLEELLRRQEAALAARVSLPIAPLPDVDAPIPAALRPRAIALLDRCRHLEEQAAEVLDQHRRRMPAFATRVEGTDLGVM
jgi:hypothetical protein